MTYTIESGVPMPVNIKEAVRDLAASKIGDSIPLPEKYRASFYQAARAMGSQWITIRPEGEGKIRIWKKREPNAKTRLKIVSGNNE